MAKKDSLCNIIFNVLARGVSVLNEKDSLIKTEIDALPQNYTVSLGILPYGNYLYILKRDGKLYVDKTKQEQVDLAIAFKNAKSARRVMLAKSSIAQSYCRHDLLVSGDIAEAMGLVRVINRAEKYLFPHFMTKSFLPKIKKEYSSFCLYCKILFGSFKHKE